jgi:hypothetical protein
MLNRWRRSLGTAAVGPAADYRVSVFAFDRLQTASIKRPEDQAKESAVSLMGQGERR